MKDIVKGILSRIVVCSIFYGMWQIKRWWNYAFGYESQVQGSICEMVKPEYLKTPEKC